MRRLILFLVFLWLIIQCLLLFGCVATKTVPDSKGEIGIRISAVELVFENHSEYTHIVQEIDLGNGVHLVESFRMEDGHRTTDRASWSSIKEFRTMKVYCANVTGADEWGGFAHLPENMDGSVVTNIGPNFNRVYQRNHETKGRITKKSSNYFIWTLSSDGLNLSVRTEGIND